MMDDGYQIHRGILLTFTRCVGGIRNDRFRFPVNGQTTHRVDGSVDNSPGPDNKSRDLDVCFISSRIKKGESRG